MRSPLRVALIATLAGCFDASGAEAGTLTAATWSQVIYGFPMTRTGAQLGITGSSTATSISANLVYPTLSTRFIIPNTPNGIPECPTCAPVHHAVSITQGGAQALTATPSMGGATMGVPGHASLRTATHNTKGVNQSTFMTGVNTLVKLPLRVGVGGQFTGSFILFANHFFTVDFYGWTPGTLALTGLTSDGFALPSVVAMGSFNLTAGGGGTVTLVSPTKLSIDCFISQRRTASFASLKLHFVPEPSTLLLLSAGALARALVAIRRG